MLKTTALVLTVSVAVGTSALAGGFAPEIVEAPVVIVEPEETRSTWGIVIPLIALAALVALASSNSDEGETVETPEPPPPPCVC